MFAMPVVSVRHLSPDVFELELVRNRIPFEPGENCVLFNDGVDSRPYSIASGTTEDVFRFLIRRMPGGAVSDWLSARKRGDVVRASFPFGEFRPGLPASGSVDHVFIATGVGIAPFLSFLRSGTPAVRPRCLYGVRHFRDAADLDLLRARTDLTLAVSRDAPEGVFQGRVTALLDRLVITPSTHLYLCGLSAMVDECAYWLRDHGVAPDRIHAEVFFGAG